MGDDGPGAAGFLAGLSVGSRVAGYRLEEQIGQGGMAVVFRAQDERLQRQVALKILSPALATDETFRHRFIRESRSAAAVDDPHIIPVFEAGDADGMLFIAMRYVPGGDVGTLVRRLGPLPIARAAAIISAVASALDTAHAAGLVHRDVKPGNMLVDARPGRPDHVYLSDFGLTKGALSSASLTGTGHVLGTLNYCAPEQIQGQRVDARTDEYALACAAFALLSGEPPFPRDEGMAVLYAQLSAPPPRLTSRRPGLPPAVDEVLLRALAKAPEGRYASCGEFADALRMAFGLQRYDSDVAIALHQRSLTDQQYRLGLDHADTLATHASLTAAYQEARRSDEAIALHQRTLTDQQHTLGPDHPDTLATRFSIAQEMAARGEHAGAEAAVPGRVRGPAEDAGPGPPGHAGHPVQHRPGDGGARRSCRGGGPVPRRVRGPAADAGPGPPGHAGHPVQHRPGDGSGRRPCRRQRTCSGMCSRPGSGRWGRITRTRWPPGSASPRRWQRAAIMPGQRTCSGMCSRPGSGHWGRITRTRWPPGSASAKRWRRAATSRGREGVPGGAGRADANLGLGSPGHADRPVQHRPGDGSARGPCRGRGPVPGSAAPPGAEAGPRPPGHAGHPVQHRPGDGGA